MDANQRRVVKLTYFKHTTGKWYTSGEYETEKEWAWEVFAEVQEMWNRRELPGLVRGCSPFLTLVETPNHKYPVSHLIGVSELREDAAREALIDHGLIGAPSGEEARG